MSRHEIVTSVGTLGSEYRSDQRYYTNTPEAVNGRSVGHFLKKLPEQLDLGRHNGEEKKVTRAVVRAVANDEATARVLESPEAFTRLEAAIPIKNTGEHMLLFAQNAPERTPSAEEKQVLLGRVADTRQHRPRPEHQQLPTGFKLADTWGDSESLHSLWGPTFGWTPEATTNFIRQIQEQSDMTPTERTLWYQGITDGDDKLVAAGMAERLDMPSNHPVGQVALIELTEWAVEPEVRRHRIGPVMIYHLADAVRRDLNGTPHVSFAETNLRSGADRAGVKSGLAIPRVSGPLGEVPQVLFNNVSVDDNMGEEPHRSFVVVCDVKNNRGV